MLKLHSLFFRKFALIYLGLFFVLGVGFYFFLKNSIENQTKTDLLHNITIFGAGLTSIDGIDQKTQNLKKLLGFRITVIDENGIVIAETDKQKHLLENHLNRIEVIQARYQEYGSAIRQSDTVKKDLLYVAKQFQIDRKIYYIRMARDLDQIQKEFFETVWRVGIVFFLFLALALFVSLQLSKDLEIEINKILRFLKLLTKQKKAEIIDSKHSSELSKITRLLSAVSQSLSKKEKQKAKYTAKLKLSNRQKDDIISAISHEFKNPIAVISGYSQTLIDDKEINQTIQKKFLEKILSNARKMTTMIDRLRLSIRLDDGKIESKKKQVNLKELIKNQIDDLKSAYPKREILFDGEDLIVEVDETLFGIAIINIIENGLKYSQDRVYVTLTKESIMVRDNGIGIPQKEIENITKKFYRVTTNGWNNSLGVGLSLVQNILIHHNFKLQIESKENEGSTFTIVFQ